METDYFIGMAQQSLWILALASAPLLLPVLVIGVLLGMVQAVQQHFAPLFVEHGVELAVAGTLISVMALTGVVSNMAVGTLNDRRGTVTAAVFALACQLVSMAAYVVGVGFVPLALATVLFGFGAVLQPRPCAAGSRPESPMRTMEQGSSCSARNVSGIMVPWSSVASCSPLVPAGTPARLAFISSAATNSSS